MIRQYYTQRLVTDMFEDWNRNQQSDLPLSMRQFCRVWSVPRSTFQRWLNKLDEQAITNLPADRFYAKPTATSESHKAPIDAEVVEVLRMLANELSAIATDLNELLDKL